jgi:hypothetical protein
MHKKQASLVPLNFEYAVSSEHEEAADGAAEGNLGRRSPPGSAVLSRKSSSRVKSPE